jgi:hypothetical protein
MRNVISAAALVIAMMFGGYGVGQMYHVGIADAQPAVVEAGSAAAGSATTPKPHEQIDNPVEQPKDFVGDMKTAKTKGWFAFVLVGLYGLCRALGTLSKKYARFDFLNKGRTAMIIAGAGTVLAASVDAVMYGGTLVSVGVAAVWALVGLMSPAAKVKES